ncbi:CoA pyrophosphatase [Pelagovum sp. HNIBRBA483]|uniref:CoA pyrophosphatase n=1 Tax=Pelagovum sp. HNIBRBA483 TaxID=3233341 RepID=UPI0034A4ED2E
MTEIRPWLERAISAEGRPSSDYDLNPERPVVSVSQLKPAAVLVPISLERRSVILTKRSARLRHHAGQIAFPGGKKDLTDATLESAALRESFEEIGLHPKDVIVLGALPEHETVTAFSVTPFVGLVSQDYLPKREIGEVDEIFEVPLDFLAKPDSFRIEGRRWQGRKRYYYAAPYGPYYIWGATARILRAFADRLHDAGI